MKLKLDFVTNSSSTGYIIHVSKGPITAKQFVEGIFEQVVDEMESYDFQYSKDVLIKALNQYYEYFPMKEGYHSVSFGDEDGNEAGRCFDYCLREGASGDGFDVSFSEHLR